MNCQMCSSKTPAPMTIVMGDGQELHLCVEHYELVWNDIPKLLMQLTLLFLKGQR